MTFKSHWKLFHGIKSMQMTLALSVLNILVPHCVLWHLKLKIKQINEEENYVKWENLCRISSADSSQSELGLTVLEICSHGKDWENLSFEWKFWKRSGWNNQLILHILVFSILVNLCGWWNIIPNDKTIVRS